MVMVMPETISSLASRATASGSRSASRGNTARLLSKASPRMRCGWGQKASPLSSDEIHQSQPQ